MREDARMSRAGLRRQSSEDGTLLLAINVADVRRANAPACVVTARLEARPPALRGAAQGPAGTYRTRSVVARFRSAQDAVCLAASLDPAREPAVYVRTPGGAWSIVLPVEVTEESVRLFAQDRDRPLTPPGVRIKHPTPTPTFTPTPHPTPTPTPTPSPILTHERHGPDDQGPANHVGL